MNNETSAENPKAWQELLKRVALDQKIDIDKHRTVIEGLSQEYKQEVTPEDCLTDLRIIEDLRRKDQKIGSDFFGKNEKLYLKLFNFDTTVTLSKIIGALSTMSIEVLDHDGYELSFESSRLFINLFEIKTLNDLTDQDPEFQTKRKNFLEVIEALLSKRWFNSLFNKLSILQKNVNFREIKLLSALDSYAKQISNKYDHHHIESLTISYPHIFAKLIELFHKRLSPNEQNRNLSALDALKTDINEFLGRIEKINDFNTLRRFHEIILAILRTNFYQNKNYLSFKIKPSMISVSADRIKQVFAEIFVYDQTMEAIHIRGAKISRGGFRWSDRKEDYRTEALGLMRAQVKKNNIIIPSGAKGAFIIKGPTETKEEAILAYKIFLRGLLDITDNLDSDNNVIRPVNVVMPQDLSSSLIEDEKSDPYIVAAADKGTATFSDCANSISAEYKFWLADAFASGGSNGYDHKKLAITARGAWITVEKLFSEIGINPKKDLFTAIGIGDMSGDVFGNGMLLSDRMKLVAAFNHKHIFIDPNPEPLESFAERKRLFDLPTSNWSDYNNSLISKGGGIFSRNEKSILITDQIRYVLDIPSNQQKIDPDDLIRHILKSRVDLVWNGGIGTFFKNEDESNDMVQDRANDNIRINGDEVRAKVIAEGGNLGLTPNARIEYARTGGKINSDFIDNSAGVSCSDREVNIKISFSKALLSQKISFEIRNELLAEMENEVCELVLKDNVLQNNALTIEQFHGVDALDKHQKLIQRLEVEGILDRKFENISSNEVVKELRHKKKGLTRPELATILSYTKIWIKREILASNIPDDEYFEKYLIGYFPLLMQQNFKEAIISHPLRREIISNYVTNTLINRVGINFIPSVLENTGKSLSDAVYAYIIIRDSYKLREIWHNIEYIDSPEIKRIRVKTLIDARKFMEYSVCKYLTTFKIDVKLPTQVRDFSSEIEKLFRDFEEIVTARMLEAFFMKRAHMISSGLDEAVADKLLKIRFLVFAISIISIHKKSETDLKIVAKLYFEVEEALNVYELRKAILSWSIQKARQENLLYLLISEIDSEHEKFVYALLYTNPEIKSGAASLPILTRWTEDNISKLESYKSAVNIVKLLENFDSGEVLIAIHKLRQLWRSN